MLYTLIIKPAEEGGYVGMVPEIPGAFTQGETEDEVRENIKDAINLLHEVRMEQALKDLGATRYIIEQIAI